MPDHHIGRAHCIGVLSLPALVVNTLPVPAMHGKFQRHMPNPPRPMTANRCPERSRQCCIGDKS